MFYDLFSGVKWEVRANDHYFHQSCRRKSFLCFRWGRYAVREKRFDSYCLERSSYGSIKQHLIPLGCHTYVDLSSGVTASTQFYLLFNTFLMGFVSRTMWCGATNTPLWHFCPLTCMNSSSEWRIFSSYLLWSCRFVGFISHFSDRKIHDANSRLNAKPSYLTGTLFLWILN